MTVQHFIRKYIVVLCLKCISVMNNEKNINLQNVA